MSRSNAIHALELGGTLFVPASHKDLKTILSGQKYPDLRSVVIDFEDGLANSDREEALEHLDTTLENLHKTKLLRFIRPQNPQMLKAFMQHKNIEKIDGFILPKFDLENAIEYLTLIQHFRFMPSIEGNELFDIQKLQQLREILIPYTEQLICIRFGAQDMLRQLGLKQHGSIYDMLLPSHIVANLITTFKPHGFEISAPVYPDFSDTEGFLKEAAYELQNGLISKTIIHPIQIELMNKVYQISQKELDAAKQILSKSDGVFNLDGQMGERKTQNSWAKNIEKRLNIYGFRTQ